MSDDERYANGILKEKAAEATRRYRQRQKIGVALLRAAEARGLSGGEALAVLQHASYAELQRCQSAGINA